MRRSRVFTEGGALATSQAVKALSSLFRNILIANAVSVESFGIALTFALAVTFLELTTDLGLNRILVQHRLGSTPQMLDAVHFVHATKGVLLSALLFASAPLVSKFFNVLDLEWAYRSLALVPLINGLEHFDARVAQRNYRFKQTALVDGIPPIVSLASAYLFLDFLHDHRVMLVAIFAQVTTKTSISHLLAKRRYRWRLRREELSYILRFGWPLLIGGTLLFLVQQGDRAIIGRYLGMETLAWYGAALSMAMMPSGIILGLLSTALLPALSSVQGDYEEYRKRATNLITVYTVACIAYASALLLLGGDVLVLAFGDNYRSGAEIIVFFGLLLATRILRGAPVVIAISQAQTTIPLVANVVRAIAVPLAVMCLVAGMSVVAVAVCGLAMEVAAFLTAVALSTRKLEAKKLRPHFLLNTAVVITACMVLLLLAPEQGTTLSIVELVVNCIRALAVGSLLCCLPILLSNQARQYFLTVFQSKSK